MINQNPNLEISTVVGCRMMCSYCPQSLHIREYAKRPHTGHVMSLETYQKCLESVPTKVSIIFAGMAEPWLNPACTDMILYAARRGHLLSVFTTTLGLKPEDVGKICHIPFKHFCIHLPDADGQMRLDPDTPGYLEGLTACARSIPSRTFVQYGSLHQKVRAALAFDVSDSTGSLISRAGNLPSKIIPRKTGKLMCSSCGPKIDHNVLLPNGDVVLCCMIYDLKHILGNLLQQSYPSLFEGCEYQRVMRGMAGDESIDIACRTCEIAVPA